MVLALTYDLKNLYRYQCSCTIQIEECSYPCEKILPKTKSANCNADHFMLPSMTQTKLVPISLRVTWCWILTRYYCPKWRVLLPGDYVALWCTKNVCSMILCSFLFWFFSTFYPRGRTPWSSCGSYQLTGAWLCTQGLEWLERWTRGHRLCSTTQRTTVSTVTKYSELLSQKWSEKWLSIADSKYNIL